MPGGKRPGAGRPPGARNRKTVKMQAAIAQSGMTPLDYMVAVMRNEDNDPRTRLEAAHHAAPYVHSKLSTTDLTVNAEDKLSEEELRAKLRMLLGNMDPALLSELVGDLLESPESGERDLTRTEKPSSSIAYLPVRS